MMTRIPYGVHHIVGVPELVRNVFSIEALPCGWRKLNLPEIDPSVYANLVMIKIIIIKWGKRVNWGNWSTIYKKKPV